MPSVDQLWRFPVKSMQGESVPSVSITPRGVVGDRAWALVSVDDGKVVSAKNPRKWGRALELTAAFVEPPAAGTAAAPVAITLPDGTTVRSDRTGDDASGVLSAFLGRDVQLTSAVPSTPTMEETWPNEVDGLAPAPFIDSTRVGSDGADTVSDITMAMAAAGTFFDLAFLHLMTRSTLDTLRAAHPGGDFDVRRYRANVIVADAGEGFAENAWVGRALTLGSAGATMQVTLATMRCVMTTLAQPDLARDVSLLQTIARTNRVSMLGGEWACAGVYGDAVGSGEVHVGDDVVVGPALAAS